MRIPVDSIDERGREVHVGLADAWAVRAAAAALDTTPEALDASLHIERRGPVLYVSGRVTARSMHPCDRCGEAVATDLVHEGELAYVAEAGGQRDIFVKPFPSLDGSQQITHDGGLDPVWASTGELFYRQGSRLMVMRTSSAAGFSADRSEALFDVRFDLQADGLRNFDVTSEGRRFLMVKND